MTKQQSDALDAIIEELQQQMPKASVTTSSIAMYALEKYVSEQHIAKRDGTKIYIEINTSLATEEDIKKLYDLLGKLFDETKENYSQAVHYMVGEIFSPVMMKMAKQMMPKKPAEVGENAKCWM